MLHVKVLTKGTNLFMSKTVAHINTHETLTKSIGTSTEHSDYECRRRAFQRGSIILFLNREKLTTFVTLTYKNQHSDYQQILNDLKNNFSRRGISYLAVVEKHKSGCYHIHAITSDLPAVVSLRQGKQSWGLWKKGFSDIKFLKDTDEKFRIERYIFKYMTKAERVGGRFFLKSRDLTLPPNSDPEQIKLFVLEKTEQNTYDINGYKILSEKRYYGKNTPQ